MKARLVLTRNALRPNSGDSPRLPKILQISGMHVAYLRQRLNIKSGALEVGSQNRLAVEFEAARAGEVAADLDIFCEGMEARIDWRMDRVCASDWASAS